MEVYNHPQKVTGGHVDLEKEDDKVEKRQRDIRSHDVSSPVPANMCARLAGHVKGVRYRVMTRRASPTKNTRPVEALTNLTGELTSVGGRQRMVEHLRAKLADVGRTVVVHAATN